MKIFQHFHKKIPRNAGFSLAEVLFAILILMLASAIVATGVPLAKNAYDKVVVAANAEVLLSTTVTALRDELGTARDIEVKDNTTITYYDADINAWSKIYLNPSVNPAVDPPKDPAKDPDGTIIPVGTIMIQRYVSHGNISVKNDEDFKEGDEYRLVSKAAGDNHHGLYATYGEVTGPDDDGVITIKDLEVRRGSDTLAAMPEPENVLKICVVSGG